VNAIWEFDSDGLAVGYGARGAVADMVVPHLLAKAKSA